MSRKLIKLGNSTLVVSLPSEWVSKYGLSSGDEVNVEDSGRSLSVSTTNTVSFERKTFDLSEMGDEAIKNSLSAAYIKGYDEAEFEFSDPAVLKIIQESSANLIGFEIIKQGNNYCVLKDISGAASQTSLDDSLSRLYSLIVSISIDSLDAVQARNLKALQNISERDVVINKFAFFCMRVLNKKGAKNFRNTLSMHTIIFMLEILANRYSHICNELAKTKARPSQNFLNVFEKCTESIKLLYALFQKFDFQKAERLFEIRNEVSKFCAENKMKNSVEFESVFYLQSITNLSADVLRLNFALSA